MPETSVFRINGSGLLRILILILLSAPFAGCTPETTEVEYVARLGDRHFTRSDLDVALESLNVLQDSSEAASQIVNQWVTDELLYHAAVRRGLRNQESVRRLLEENERSVLVSALLSELYEEEITEPSEDDLLTYYEQNKDQLKLAEPFVRVRYLVTDSADSADVAVTELENIGDGDTADSTWYGLIDRFTSDPQGAEALATSFYPESRLLSTIPGLSTAVGQLIPGQILSPFEIDGQYHIVQLVDRLAIGTVPDLRLVRDQLRARVAIENRKQLYARQVQRLRNEALAREELEIR